LAELELQSGDRASWVDTSKRLVIEYPGSDAALDALDSLLQNGVPVSLVQQAQVHLAHGDRSGAELLLLGAVTRGGPSEVAEAAFRLGLLRELAGDAEGALAWFELSQPDASAEYAAELELHRLENSLLMGDDGAAAAIEQYAIAHRGSTSAISAANSLARFYESEADFSEAARLRLGAAQFALEAGDTDAAIEAAERAAKLFFQVEDDQSAYAALLSVASADPGSFAAIRAESRLGDSRSSQLPAHYVDVSIETWIEDFAAGSTSLASERMHAASAAAVELQTAGLHPESDSQMADIIPLARHSPAFLSNLGTQAASNGQTAVAARAAGALLASLSPDVRQHVPRRLGELAYPRPYLEIAESEARSVGLDPLLLYALIRQESFFDPLAHSPAQARGLTQIIPATAHEIASRLGVQGFVQEDLYRPTISLAFGAYYLAAQLDAFDGFPYAALAAYNGGPGNARRWGVNGGFTDSDVYLSQIDFEETHNYVRRVMENYAHYRALYLGETRPRLPE
jgi:soluble lytic murein transglycosylase